MTALLQVEGVSKSFGGVAANQDVSIRVNEGEIVGLIGPNGSGKTTLFNSIVGFHPIDGGSVRFQDREISALRVPLIARQGLLRKDQFGRGKNAACEQPELGQDRRAESVRCK